MTEALRALGVLAEPPCSEHAAIAAALELPPPPSADEHMAVLGFQLPPYASIYLGAEGMLGGEARDRIAGFWRALGGQPPREPDHLSVLCAALAELAGADPRIRTARAALYWEHVASWMPPYLAALRRIGSPFHAAWAATLDAVFAAEAEVIGPPSALPLALRAVAAPEGPPADLDALLGAVLAPVRIGMVITRDDLARCAAVLGFGLRAGERRFALRSLLGQDAGEVLGWLAGEARRQADAHGGGSMIPRWWQARGRAGADWLDGLARAAAGSPAIAG
ncbi:MAG TPA: molecular chaperone TorD family protein [Kofleriaceae bacterium]|nr:molecular chaperone TorD family protein [Kofleriaceae bacterium]